jgi:hypothetical protein
MARRHRVEQGESLYSIAHAYGVRCWEALRDHPANAALMAARPHPQILHPGDELAIPDAEPGVPVPIDRRTQFRRRPRTTQPLRLTLQHIDGTPMRECDFTLVHDGTELQGRTDAQGVLAVELPLAVRTCTLRAGAYEWELAVAHLNPSRDTEDDGVSGCDGRLLNLGWCHDPSIDEEDDPAPRRARELFQVAHQLERTGELDDVTREHLARHHGC